MKRLLGVSASAGSGKTFSLASRYLSLLFQEIKPNDILAVTFTNKAANEMKERILKYLINLDKDMLENISKETGIAKKIILDRREKVLYNFLTTDIHILTIDSFINKILRKFSWYLKIESDFEIASDNQEIIFRKFLDIVSQNRTDFENLITLAKREDKLQNNLQNLLETLYEKDKELPTLDFSIQKLPDEKRVFELFEELKRMVLSKHSTKTLVNFFKPITKVEDIISRTWFKKESLNYRTFSKVYSEELDYLFFDLKKEVENYLKILYHNREVEFLKNLLNLYKKYKIIKFQHKKENNYLDFKDIENLTYTLLKEEQFVEDIKEFIYFRLDSKISHILIDEFQDTSITQWEIFEPLVEEIASGYGVEPFKSFFYVGDIKQSIYRFRGGQKELFYQVKNRFKPFGLEITELEYNYRSKEVIVNFVNETFKTLLKKYNQKPQKISPQKIDKQQGGYVKIITEKEPLSGLKKSLKFLFDKGVEDKDIAILVWKNDEILEVANFIKKEFQKEVVTSTRAKVIKQPFAMAIINLMKYLSNKDNLIYKLNFLSLIGKKYHENEIKIKIEKPSKMIKNIMKQFNLIDESSLRLYEYSFKYPTLIDFVTDIDSFNEELPNKELNGIQVLTIHKSKGLEFQNVIVLDIFTKKMNRVGDIIFDYDKTKLKTLKINFSNREEIDKEFAQIKKKEQQLSIEDDVNAEYVAFTRAINSLFIVKKEETSFVTYLEDNKEYGEFQLQTEEKKEEKIEKFNLKLKNYGKQEYKELEEEYKANDFNAIYFGLATHYMFECENIDAVKNKYGEFCDISKVLKHYQEAKKLLPKSNNYYKEFPFIFNEKIGIIDLMIIDKDEIIIIDYKTHSPNDEKQYIKQIKRYKEAIHNLFKKPTKGKIFYLDRMKFKEI